MPYTTLRNDFHNTTARVRGEMSPRAYASARRRLCGMDDCACGTLRGPQDSAEVWGLWERAQIRAMYAKEPGQPPRHAR